MRKLLMSVLVIFLWNCTPTSQKEIHHEPLKAHPQVKSISYLMDADIDPFVAVENMKINEVKNLFIQMRRADQQYCDSLYNGNNKNDAFYLRKMKANDEANLKLLDKIIRVHGWPGMSIFGEEAATTAWLVIWHHRDKRHILCKYHELMEQAVSKNEMHAYALESIDKEIVLLSPDQVEY